MDGLELVVIPRKESGEWDYFELETSFFGLCERAKLLKKAE